MNVDLLHRMADADIDRFWSQVLIGSTDECWPWTGGCDDGGYGRFCALSTIFAAHQVASFLINGPPEESKPFVLHHCDNPPCCNGFHHFYGTQADNIRDGVSKGRIVVPRPDNSGSRNGRSVLTEEQVRFIKRSTLLQREIAVICDVDPTLIRRIKTGKVWRNVA